MEVPAHISIVTLGVSDLAASARFYAALGWPRSAAGGEEITWFKTGGAVLGLYPHASLAADCNLPATPRPAFSGVTLAINVATAAAVGQALAAAARAGGRILKPATQADWGGVSGYFADPDGYAWEVAWNPGFPLNSDGSVRLP
ncbi:MAG TPA: VOC family protein [Bacillota bacterium]|nr:VOC family protein [Bacillota bacterium]